MALLGIIRRWYIRDRVSIREIARRLDISRNTVRRYIRSEAIEPSYASRHSPSSLDAYAPRLSAWLSSELVKSRKQRRTLKQMFLELRGLGYEGSYDRVAAFSRQWKAGQLERVKSASKSTDGVKIAQLTLPRGQLTHILRHTFASHFVMNGGSILALQKILGHHSLAMTIRYAHLSPDHLQETKRLNPLAQLNLC